MRPGTFAGLAAVTAISVAAAAYAIVSESAVRAPSTPSHAAAFPDLLARVNDVQTVTVESATGKLTFARKGGDWTLTEKGGYPVQAEQVRKLVAGLAGLQLLEPKTDRPERHGRLEVEDIAAKEARSRLVTLLGGDGKPLAALIVGKSNNTLDLDGLRGVYVRMPAEPLAWLAEGALEVPTAATDWIDRAVVDLPAEQLRRAHFAPTAADAVTIEKAEAGATDFTLTPIPEGRSADPDAVKRLAGALAAITLDDVRSDKDVDKAVKAGTVEAVTFDGLELKAELLALDGGTWMRVNATAAEGSQATETAKTISARVTGWLYKLPQYKAGLLQPKIEDYLKQDEATPAPTPSPSP
jgi:hypothetical protein